MKLKFQNRQGQVALDQIRAVDRQRLVHKLGSVWPKTAQTISELPVEILTRS